MKASASPDTSVSNMRLGDFTTIGNLHHLPFLKGKVSCNCIFLQHSRKLRKENQSEIQHWLWAIYINQHIFIIHKTLQTTNYMLAKLIIPMSTLSWPTNNIHNLRHKFIALFYYQLPSEETKSALRRNCTTSILSDKREIKDDQFHPKLWKTFWSS